METTTTPEHAIAAVGVAAPETGWISFKQGKKHVHTSDRVLRRAAARGDLRAVRINARGDWRTRPEWLDEWLFNLQQRQQKGK